MPLKDKTRFSKNRTDQYLHDQKNNSSNSIHYMILDTALKTILNAALQNSVLSN